MAGPKLTSATLSELALYYGGASRMPDGRANRGRASPPVVAPSVNPGNVQVNTGSGNVQVDTGDGNVQVEQ